MYVFSGSISAAQSGLPPRVSQMCLARAGDNAELIRALFQDVCWVVNLLLATLTETLGEQPVPFANGKSFASLSRATPVLSFWSC